MLNIPFSNMYLKREKKKFVSIHRAVISRGEERVGIKNCTSYWESCAID